MDRLEQENVDLCRRKSGGGAVYHDLGNTCFSFLSISKEAKNFREFNNKIILEAL